MSKRDRKNGVPQTVTSIPLVDPHALSDNPSIGELVRDATTQVSTLVRAEVELAKAEITRDVKRGLTGSVFFIIAGVVLLYSTFFMFFFLAELLDTWLWRWAAFLVVFLLMLLVTALFAFLGYRKVRRIRGPQQAIESVKETTAALTPGLQKFAGGGHTTATATVPEPPTPAVAPRPRPAVASAPKPAAAPVTASIAAAEAAEAPAAQYDTTVQYQTTAEDTIYHMPEAYSEETVETVAYATEDTAAYDTVADVTEATVTYDSDGDVTEATVTYDSVADVTEATVTYVTGDTVVYATETVYSDDPTGPIPPLRSGDQTDDPTAAIYADTGLPVTPEHEHRSGDPSGW